MIKRVKLSKIHEPIEVTDYIGEEERSHMVTLAGDEFPIAALSEILDKMIKRVIVRDYVWIVAIKYCGKEFSIRAYINKAGGALSEEEYATALLAGFLWYSSSARSFSCQEYYEQLEKIVNGHKKQ